MKTLYYNQPFECESGELLPSLRIAYHTWGELNADGKNAVWVCHAFTANSDVAEWWPGTVGDGLMLDTSKYFVVCANVIGSCYGSTGPEDINPLTGNPWLNDFPVITNRDHVRAHEILRRHLGIEKIHTIIGSSIGGHQAIEYAIMQPELIDRLVFIASNARQSAWSIAINESQRMAIEADPEFFGNDPEGGSKGLEAARSIAMLSYRNRNTYNLTQSEESDARLNNYKASSYQKYQGFKLAKRYNVWSYYRMTQLSDSHNVGRGRGGVEKALQRIRAHTLCIGISSDILFPPEEQKFVAEHVANGHFIEIDSFYGHDGFLVETEKVSKLLKEFMNKIIKINRKVPEEITA